VGQDSWSLWPFSAASEDSNLWRPFLFPQSRAPALAKGKFFSLPCKVFYAPDTLTRRPFAVGSRSGMLESRARAGECSLVGQKHFFYNSPYLKDTLAYFWRTNTPRI
jgi:hypothetical protein